MPPTFTFAAIGHNEAETLAIPLACAHEAAEPGDHVWFVDSASDDGSAELARSCGVTVIEAPLGKGRAMAVARERCDDDFLVFFDADMIETQHNIPKLLREGAVARDVDMLIGAYEEPARRMTITPGIYRPLAQVLFPEVLAQDITVAFSGFRVLRTSFDFGAFPDGYGVETSLNVHVTLSGGTIASVPVGWFRGDLREYRNVVPVAADAAQALLDLAVAHGRLAPAARSAWEDWIGETIELLGRQPPPGADDEAFFDELDRLAARPAPPVR